MVKTPAIRANPNPHIVPVKGALASTPTSKPTHIGVVSDTAYPSRLRRSSSLHAVRALSQGDTLAVPVSATPRHLGNSRTRFAAHGEARGHPGSRTRSGRRVPRPGRSQAAGTHEMQVRRLLGLRHEHVAPHSAREDMVHLVRPANGLRITHGPDDGKAERETRARLL